MAKVKYDIIEPDVQSAILSDAKSPYGLHTYISLFSSAGIGCYGFKEENFYCIASVELLERRLKVQVYNHKCTYDSGYTCGDMTTQETKDKVFVELARWKKWFNIRDLDVLIATPPCQGMSVANHKKKNELKRNSLVVESIEMTRHIKPKFFIYENVRAFLTSVCTDIDGKDKTIKESIDNNLSGEYNILYRVVNFKEYGSPSSRTRTLVIGVRKDIKEVTPLDIFPDKQPEKTLRQTIDHLPSLLKMGEIWDKDIYPNFRKYSAHMEAWISDIKEGQSAFDNTEISKIPHTVKDGVIVYNARKIQLVSEVNDAWGNGEATQVHHIFPKDSFPQIAHYVENLILLTATQHNTKAHPNNKTQQINKDYQLVCLLAKADTIETSLRLVGERYYRKESFVYVINTGLSTDFSTSLTLGEIKTKLIQIYNAA